MDFTNVYLSIVCDDFEQPFDILSSKKLKKRKLEFKNQGLGHQFLAALSTDFVSRFLGGAFAIREENCFRIRNPKIGELEEQGIEMLSHVGSLRGNVTKTLDLVFGSEN